MKVKELIEVLNNIDEDLEIYYIDELEEINNVFGASISDIIVVSNTLKAGTGVYLLK